MAIKGRIENLNSKGYDYEIEHVQDQGRKSTAAITAVFFGFTVQFATIVVGGIIGLGLTFKDAILAIIVGNVILAIMAIASGLIGRRVGLGFSMLTRYPFGHAGSILPSICSGLVMLGWLTFCYWIFANAFQNLMQIINPSLGTLGFFLGIVISTLITVVPLTFGFEGPKWVSRIAIPVFMVPLFYVMIVLVGEAGGFANITATYTPPQPISFIYGVTLAMGAWIFGAITCPDFVRLGKSDSAAWIAPPVGLVIGESLVLFLGVLTVAATFGATWNPVEASTNLGIGISIAVIILYLAAMWATNVPTAWSSSMQFANAFRRPKTIFAIIIGLVAPVLAIIIQYSVGALVAIDGFIQILTSIIPPVGGILVAEYWILRKRKFPTILEIKRKINPSAYLAWILAVGINYWTTKLAVAAGPDVGLEYGVPGLNGYLIGLVAYLIFESVSRSLDADWSYYDINNKSI